MTLVDELSQLLNNSGTPLKKFEVTEVIATCEQVKRIILERVALWHAQMAEDWLKSVEIPEDRRQLAAQVHKDSAMALLAWAKRGDQ